MLRLLQRGPSLVGEVGWSRDTDDVSVQLDQATTSENVSHYVGGVRWIGHTGGRAWPYGQVLIGAATVRSSVSFDDDTLGDARGIGHENPVHHPAGRRPHAGRWRRVDVFGQVDYRRLFLKEDEDGAFRSQ